MCPGPAIDIALAAPSSARLKPFARRGALVEWRGSTYMADHDADAGAGRTFRPPQATAFPHRIDSGLRDSAMHQLMPPLKFRQLPKEWTDCDGQIHWFFVCNGSQAGTHQPSPDDCNHCAGDLEPGRFQLRRRASVWPPY